MSKKWVAIVAAALLVLGSGSVAYARFAGRAGHMGHMGMFGEWKMAQLEVRLKLTPEQSKQMRDIVASRRTKLVEDFDAGRDDRRALVREIFKDNPSQAELQKRVSAIQERQNAMVSQIVAAGLDFNKTLTPEQRVEMQRIIGEQIQVGDKMREHRRQRMMEHHPEGPGPKPGPK
ncbi:MAG: Spy/CpxP family protein refolding chaperone [Terriglobales bacterium]